MSPDNTFAELEHLIDDLEADVDALQAIRPWAVEARRRQIDQIAIRSSRASTLLVEGRMSDAARFEPLANRLIALLNKNRAEAARTRRVAQSLK